MPKLTKDKIKEVENALLNYPTATDAELAKRTGVVRQTISKVRAQVDMRYDIEFVKVSAGRFIKKFEETGDYWEHQIEKLEDLKTKQKTVLRQGESGGWFEDTVDLSPMEILAIEREQARIKKDILMVASQGRIREVIKLLRAGEVKMFT